MSLESRINQTINTRGEEMGQESQRNNLLENIKVILGSIINNEENKWRHRGVKFTLDDYETIMKLIKEDNRRKEINAEVLQHQNVDEYQQKMTDLVEGIFTNYVEGMTQSNYVDPRELTTDELLYDLRNGVVRIVFTKKGKPLRDDDNNLMKDDRGQLIYDGGEKRVLWGTRNADLIQLYEQNVRTRGVKPRFDEDKVQNEIDKDYLQVLDLEKEEFRSFKPSMLYDADRDNNVGSWVVFSVDNDAWFNCVKEGVPIRDYYQEGSKEALMAPKNTNRTQLETQYYNEAKESGMIKTPQVVKWERLNQQNFLEGERQYTKILNGTYGDSKVDEAYDKIKEFPKTKSDAIEQVLEREGKGNLYVSKRLERRQSNKQTVNSSIEFRIGDALIVISPYYIVNTKTGKVYLDQYDLFKKGTTQGLVKDEIDVSTISDKVAGPFIQELINQANLLNLPKPVLRRRQLSEKDYRRLQRLRYLHDNRTSDNIKQYLAQKQVRLGYIDGRELYKITVAGTGVVFTVNSRTVAWQSPLTQQPEKIVHIVRHTSALKEIRQGLRTVARKYRGNEKVLKALAVLEDFLVDNIFNLRKKEDQGVYFE